MIEKFFRLFSLIGLSILITLSFGQLASADSIVSDNAGLLSADEADQIQSSCDTIQERFETSVYIVTSSEIGQKDDYEKYMESIAKSENSPKNLILVFISTKKNSHVYQVYSFGKAKEMLDQERCNAIMDDMNSDLLDGDYYSALDTFCDEAQEYMGKDPMLDSIVFSPIPQLIFCLLLTCGIVYLMIRNNTGKNKTTRNPYIDSNHSMVLGKIDHFTHTTVTRVQKPKKNNNGDSNNHNCE